RRGDRHDQRTLAAGPRLIELDGTLRAGERDSCHEEQRLFAEPELQLRRRRVERGICRRIAALQLEVRREQRRVDAQGNENCEDNREVSRRLLHCSNFSGRQSCPARNYSCALRAFTSSTRARTSAAPRWSRRTR